MFEKGERIHVKVEREDVDWRVDDPGTSQGIELKREPGVEKKKTKREKLKLDWFKCDEPNCEFSTKYKANLNSHAAVHSDERPYRCDKPNCEFSTKYAGHLNTHAKVHSDERPHKCDKPNCKFSTIYKRHLYLHAAVHSDERPHKCDKCKIRFKDSQALKRHRILHSEETTFQCDKCEKVCKTSLTLKRHLELHSEETPFQCDKCERAFKSKYYLNSHKLTHKSKDEWYKCDKCRYTSPFNNNFRKHKLTHANINSIKCEHCNYSCKSKARLAYHFVSKHSTMEPYRCDYPDCQYTTRLKGSMRAHKKYIHDSKKPFKCEQCPRVFKRKTHLKHHSYVHTRIKRFKCRKCKYACSFNPSLRSHETRMHSNEKRHKCDECGKSYHLKDGLRKHKLNHNGVVKKCHLIHSNLIKEFSCGECDYRTKNPRYLRQHQLGTSHSISNANNGMKCDQCGLSLRHKSDVTSHRDAHRPCFVSLPRVAVPRDIILDVIAPSILRVKIELNDDVIKIENV